MENKQRTTSVKYDKAQMKLLGIVNRIVRAPEWNPIDQRVDILQGRAGSGVYQIQRHLGYTGLGPYGLLRATFQITEIPAERGDEVLQFLVYFICKKPPHAAYLSREDLDLSMSFGLLSRAAVSDEMYCRAIDIFGELMPEKEEHCMNAEELEVKYLEINGGYHPTLTVDEWKEAVLCDNTREGYWSWVVEELRHYAPKSVQVEGQLRQYTYQRGSDQ